MNRTRRAFDRAILKSLLSVRTRDSVDNSEDPDAVDEDVWRTVSEGNNKGKHYRIETETGEIKGGLGGKLNGVKARSRAQREAAESPQNTEQHKASNSAWHDSLATEKSKILSEGKADQARFLFENEFLSYDDAVDCMKQGTAASKIEEYFDIMAANGDPKPTKATAGNSTMSYKDVMSQYGDYSKYRAAVVKQNTGWDDAKVADHLKNFETWFGGSWDKADTAKLDEYIEAAPAYDGTLYRGLHFTDSEYADFMESVVPGSKIKMRGMNSSWTDDQETAVQWASNGDRSVVIICDKNRTSTPVNALSHQGENEVLAHSKASWTVLRVDEGDNRTEIHVIERGQYDEE